MAISSRPSADPSTVASGVRSSWLSTLKKRLRLASAPVANCIMPTPPIEKKFISVTGKAEDKDDFFIVDRAQGTIFWDADGSGAKARARRTGPANARAAVALARCCIPAGAGGVTTTTAST